MQLGPFLAADAVNPLDQPLDLEELLTAVLAGVLGHQRRAQSANVFVKPSPVLGLFERDMPGYVQLAVDPQAAVREIGRADGDELVIEVGWWRRNLILPRALVNLPTAGAKLDDHVLKVRFEAGPPAQTGATRR